MLAERWGLAPGAAKAQARDIMEFWDEHVGVFVASSVTGDIEPRSRVFAEVGEAMWAERQSPEIRRGWITAALADDDRREQSVLAAGLAADVATELIDMTCRAADPVARSRGLLWAADATTEGAQPAADSLVALIDALAQAAASPEAVAMEASGGTTSLEGNAPNPGWQYALRIAMLPLPITLRSRRDRVLAGIDLSDDERPLAAALTALTDAGTDASDRLEPGQEEAVRQFLLRPLPERDASPTQSGVRLAPAERVGGRAVLLPGHLQAAERAAGYAGQLGQPAVSAIYGIARHGYLRDYERIYSQMVAVGYPDPGPPLVSAKITRATSETFDPWEDWEPFFVAAASLEAPRALTAAERWRYPHLADLDDVLDTGKAELTAITRAFTTDQTLLPGCLRAAAHAAGLDLSAISAEATVVLEKWPAGNRDVINVMFAPSLSPSPALDSARLDDQDKDVLIEALGATSDWLAGIAYTLLLPAHDPVAGQRSAGQIPRIPPNRRENAAMIAVANDPSPPDAAVRLLDGTDPLARVGAAAAAQMLADGGGAIAWAQLLTRARADGDLTVQLAAGADKRAAEAAVFWTCRDCGRPNAVDAGQCSHCRKGTRPLGLGRPRRRGKTGRLRQARSARALRSPARRARRSGNGRSRNWSGAEPRTWRTSMPGAGSRTRRMGSADPHVRRQGQ